MEGINIFVIIIAVIWTLFWKGWSLWTSARTGNKRWFIALAIFNTVGILDIFYLFYVAKKTPADIKRLFKTKL